MAKGRLLVAILCLLLALGCSQAEPPDRSGEPSSGGAATSDTQDDEGEPTAGAPNVVLVVIDDFSMDLVPTMSSLRRLRRIGASYPNSFVVDSLCCVSRASILTGQYPHQTGVRANTANLPNRDGPVGGWPAFEAYGNGERALPVQLQEDGWTTGFVGKYLNEYSKEHGLPPTPVGWDEFRPLFGGAYAGWGFAGMEALDGQQGRLLRYPAPPASASDSEKDQWYAGTIAANLTTDFLADHEDDAAPYFLTVAPYAPHPRIGKPTYAGDPWAPPAFADRPGPRKPGGNCGLLECSELGTDDLPGWADDRSDNRPVHGDGRPAQRWLKVKDGFTRRSTTDFLRNRARMAQSVDRMLNDLLDRVAADNTIVIVTSDNGFHLGQHGFAEGKGLAYDSDIRVPLYVAGPGIRPGPRPDVVSNVDLAPTIEELAGLPVADYRGGVSFADSLLAGPADRDVRRNAADFMFVEHTWAKTGIGDPDRPFRGTSKGQIPDYVAVRSRTGLLIRSDLNRDPERERYVYEFYSYRDVGWERRNQFTEPRHTAEVSVLVSRLAAFDDCQSVTRDDPWPHSCERLRFN